MLSEDRFKNSYSSLKTWQLKFGVTPITLEKDFSSCCLKFNSSKKPYKSPSIKLKYDRCSTMVVRATVARQTRVQFPPSVL